MIARIPAFAWINISIGLRFETSPCLVLGEVSKVLRHLEMPANLPFVLSGAALAII